MIKLHHARHDQRLTSALKKSDDPAAPFSPIDWNIALSQISNQLIWIKQQHGGNSIAIALVGRPIIRTFYTAWLSSK